MRSRAATLLAAGLVLAETSAFEPPPVPAAIGNLSVSNGSFCFSWTSTGYWAQSTADLNSPGWIPLPGAGGSISNRVCDTIVSNASRFYRLSRDGGGFSLAGAVYSVNVVGYVNRSFAAGTNYIANPFFAMTNNTLSEVLPVVPDGTVIYKADTVRWASSVYVNGAGWLDGVTHSPSTMTLRPGDGAVMVNPAPANITFFGEVPLGFVAECLPAGFSHISCPVPRSGRITSDLGFPAMLDDNLILFDSVSRVFRYYVYDGFEWWSETGPFEPVIAVGQPFWLWTDVSRTWVFNFSANLAFGGCASTPTLPPCSVPWAPDFGATGEPVILVQPLSQTLPAGTNVTFAADACGAPPLSFRWRFNGAPISGATNRTYSRAGLASTNAGGYSVVVSNAFGVATSAVANLVVITPPPPPPVILNIMSAGGTVNFTFTTAFGSQYEVQYTDNLNSPNWSALAGFRPGTGATVTVSDPFMSGFSRFYRVVDWTHGLYSQNVVGYVNRMVGGSWNVMANPFRFSALNRVDDVFGGYAPLDESLMYKVRPPDFECAQFFGGSGWLNCDTFNTTTMTLSPGEGVLHFTEVSDTVTFLGEVMEGSLTNKLPAGLSLCSSIVPRTGPVSSLFSGLGFPAEAGDVLYKFHQPSQSYLAYTYRGADTWEPYEPVIEVGEAFWAELSSPREWVQQFSTGGSGLRTYAVTNLPYVGPSNPLVPGRTRPQIVIQPQARTNLAGTVAMFSVNASGSPVLRYQWRRGNTAIAGATNATLTLSNVQPADAGDYRTVITNAYGSVTSDVVRLTIREPAIAPVLQIARSGVNVTISWPESAGDFVLQTSTDLFTWTDLPFNTSPFTGAASFGRKFFRLQKPGSQEYSRNVVGYVNLAAGSQWNVFANPLRASPLNLLTEVLQGYSPPDESLLLKVQPPAFECAQFFDGGWVDCDTFNTSTMTLSPGEGVLHFTDLPGTITFVGEVPEGLLTSKLPAGLSLCSAIAPQAGLVASSLGFPVEAGDVFYKFHRPSQGYVAHTHLESGAWEPYEPVIEVGEAFWVELGSPRDWIRQFSASDVAVGAYSVTNRPYLGGPHPMVPGRIPPQILARPQSRTNLVGTDATFSVSASGSPLLRYQWLFGGVAIPGATNPTHAVVNVQLTSAGSFSVIVSNAFGSIISAPAALTVIADAAYVAVVQTDVNVAPAGTPVPLTGAATYQQTGQPAAFKPVQIHVLVQGAERVLATMTDFAGQFSATFVPLATEVGHYEVVATPPGVLLEGATFTGASPVAGRLSDSVAAGPPPGGWVSQDAFDLVDLRFLPPRSAIRIPALTAMTNTTVVTNVSQLAITGITVTSEGVPPGVLQVEVLTAPGNVPATTDAELVCAIRSLTDVSWQGTITIVLTDGLGLRAELPLDVTVAPAHPQLIALPAQLEAGMVTGRQTLMEFELRNVGGRDSGPITVELPPGFDWLRLVTPSPLPSLVPDGTAKIALQLLPEVGLPVGDYANVLTVGYGSASLPVPFAFRALSDARVAVLVTAEDEYTYYAEGAPRVTNALVTLTDEIDGSVAHSGFTGADGRLLLPAVREGYYSLDVSADRHERFRATIRVRPGQTRSVVAFLPREMVTYLFSVEGTHVDGRVRIGVETVFEAFVPAPVITVTPVVIDLARFSNDVSHISLWVTNHGLVAARDLRLTFATHSCWRIDPLTPDLGTLSPQAYLEVPVTITRLSVPGTNNPCGPCEFAGRLDWTLPLGAVDRPYRQNISVIHACYPPPLPAPQPPCLTCGGGPGVFGGPAGPGGPGGLGDDGFQRHSDGGQETWEGDEEDGGGDGSFPARVQLHLEPTVVVGLNAFRARLDIFNPLPSPITNLFAALALKDAAGANASNRFAFHPPDLRGITSLNGGMIPGNSTGSVSWVFVPTLAAAPAGPAVYYVGGTLAYGHEGYRFNWALGPVGFRVLPTPRLTVNLFHQRDVFSDDPFTPEREPPVPFSLATLIRNLGPVSARDVRLEAPEVKIVSNQQGLLIDFQLVQSQVGNAPASDGLTLNFGTLTNGQIAVGRWLMTASLQGLFTDYSATLVYSDDLGAPQLVPIEEVGIHEMIRMVKDHRPGHDDLPDFLVNDLSDPPWDLPDTLYLSNGGTNAVAVSTNGVFSGGPTPGQLLVTLTQTAAAGWTYSRLPDPGDGRYVLVAVERSDGALLPTNNFWQTDRVFVEGAAPIKTNLLHFLDHDSTAIHTLHFALAPDTNPPSSQVAGLPANSPSSFAVNWSGTDGAGLGIALFDLYVSIDNGPASNWLAQTTATNAIFNATPGHCYAFYSVATDYSGNRETPPGQADAQTCVLPGNRPPVLNVLADITLVEGVPLIRTITAVDPDPGDVLTYALIAGPPNAVMNTNSGLLTWPTGETDGGSSNFFRVVVTDSGLLSDARSFVVLVLESNSPPRLNPVTNRTIRVGETFSLTITATDPDLPPDVITYHLVQGPPGVALNVNSGLLTWTASPTNAGASVAFTVRATDPGQLRDTVSFSVFVEAGTNVPPQLAPIPTQHVIAGSCLYLTNRASDANLPAQVLRFALCGGAATGASLDPASGLFAWCPGGGSVGTSNFLCVCVSDDGSPSLSATQCFAVIVHDLPQLRLGKTSMRVNERDSVPLTLDAGPGFVQLGFRLTLDPADGLSNLILSNVSARIELPSVVEIGPGTYQIDLATKPGQVLLGNEQLGQLWFTAVPTDSKFVWLRPTNAVAAWPGGSRTSTLDLEDGRVVVVGRRPLLEVQVSGDSLFSFTLYGNSGSNYVLETSTGLESAGNWQNALPAHIPNNTLFQIFTNIDRGGTRRFFRARE